MEIKSTLTRKTYLKYLLALAFHSVSFYISTAMMIAFLVLAIIYKSQFLIIFVSIGFALLILYYAIWLLFQFYLSKNSKYFFVKRNFAFHDDGVTLKLPSLEYITKWEAFQRWTKTAGCYCLTLNNGGMFIIPESDIIAWETPHFENLLRQKIDKTEITSLTEENQ